MNDVANMAAHGGEGFNPLVRNVQYIGNYSYFGVKLMQAILCFPFVMVFLVLSLMWERKGGEKK